MTTTADLLLDEAIQTATHAWKTFGGPAYGALLGDWATSANQDSQPIIPPTSTAPKPTKPSAGSQTPTAAPHGPATNTPASPTPRPASKSAGATAASGSDSSPPDLHARPQTTDAPDIGGTP